MSERISVPSRSTTKTLRTGRVWKFLGELRRQADIASEVSLTLTLSKKQPDLADLGSRGLRSGAAASVADIRQPRVHAQ
jgi:hypothetical protein